MNIIELYNDDCMNVLDTITHEIDLVILDLPYGQTNCIWDKKIDVNLLWTKLKKISKINTAYIFFTTTKFGIELIQSNPKWFRYDLVWSKPNSGAGFLNAKKMPLRNHEMLYVFYNKLPTYNVGLYHTNKKMTNKTLPNQSVMYSGKKYSIHTEYEPRLPRSILEYSVTNKSIKGNHSTEKPVELLKWLIKYYSNENDVVLDVTMGSGSTGVASAELNRAFIGIELNKDFYDIACDRLMRFLN
jgi:site-specific DNA-methyltransferase (adenine-specific)